LIFLRVLIYYIGGTQRLKLKVMPESYGSETNCLLRPCLVAIGSSAFILKNKNNNEVIYMNIRHKLLARATVILLAMSPAWASADDHDNGGRPHGGFTNLTNTDCEDIIAAARADVANQPAAAAKEGLPFFRAGVLGAYPKYHYACVDRNGMIVRFASDADAWAGSRDVAKAKAFTAMAFSSNENALTTRTIFCATQPGGPLWDLGTTNQAGLPKGPNSINQLGVVEFPGGVPIYKGGNLVGGFGVSGDSIALDERTALAGITGAPINYGANDAIKSSTVLGVSYQLSDFKGNCTSPK
jgi:uncharacterized protein GlcG (DUF336 family)